MQETNCPITNITFIPGSETFPDPAEITEVDDAIESDDSNKDDLLNPDNDWKEY